MSCSATIVANNLFYRASLLNISHEGCRARIGAPLRSGESVQIALEAFHSLSGSVRWYKEGQVGIRFTNRISNPILAKWKAQLEEERHFEPIVPPRRRLRDFWGDARLTL
jgi:hypothetical protein